MLQSSFVLVSRVMVTCKCFLTFVYQLVFIPIKLFIHGLDAVLSDCQITKVCVMVV